MFSRIRKTGTQHTVYFLKSNNDVLFVFQVAKEKKRRERRTRHSSRKNNRKKAWGKKKDIFVCLI